MRETMTSDEAAANWHKMKQRWRDAVAMADEGKPLLMSVRGAAPVPFQRGLTEMYGVMLGNIEVTPS